MSITYYKITNGVLYLRNNSVSGYTAYGINPGWYVSPPWTENSNITSVVIENVIKPEMLYKFFQGLTNLQNIQNISNIDASNTTSMMYMFNKCSSLTSLDLSSFNTSNVESMSSMFQSCTSLKALNISHFNTSNVTNMSYMFYGCSALESLDVSHFNTSNATNMRSMFYNCSLLTSLDVSDFNTSKVTDMSHIFYGCSALESLDVSGFDTSNATNMRSMFYNCSLLTSLDVSHFNTSNVTDMSYMFFDCFALESLDLSHFNTSNVTNMIEMFYYCSSLTSLDLSHFNTSNVTNMAHMFYQCNTLISLDVSGFDTSNVTDMSHMFNKCNALKSLDVSGFDTSNVTDMGTMFQQCNTLKSLDVSGFDTSNVTNMSYMFRECVALTSLDVSGFNTSNVTNMTQMFNQCNALTSLDVSGSDFNTSNVTDMSYMFEQCNVLTSLDVSGFDTSNVTNMSYMFNQCNALTSLDVSGFDTSNVTNMRAMFSECFELESINLDNFIFNDVNAINMFSMASDTENPRSSSLQGLITINGRINDYTGFFENTTNLIVLKGNSPQLQQLTTTSANDNVKVWSLTIQPKGERDEEFPTIVDFTVNVTRFIANSDPITIKAYRNDSSTPMSLVWNESLIMDTTPKTFTTEIGSVSENESINYTFEVSDTYGTSFRKTITVPTSYYTIDFLDGGKEISFGEIASAKDLFDLLTTEPSDWSTDWTDYYEVDNNEEFVPVSDATAPTFVTDTYYKKVHDSLFKCKMDSSFNDMTPTEISDFISELDISGSPIELTQADWVVEQGITGDWTWRKWQSGIAECWGTKIHTVIVDTAWGGVYGGRSQFRLTYPDGLFVEPPNITATSSGSTTSCAGWVYSQDTGTATTSPQFNIVRGSSGGSGELTYNVYVQVKGRWK